MRTASITPTLPGPDPEIAFGPPAGRGPIEDPCFRERHLYYHLLHVDERPETLPTAFEIADARLIRAEQFDADPPGLPPQYDDAHLDHRLHETRRWWIDRCDRLRDPLADLNKDKCIHLLTQYAPMALLDGCWMQNVSSPATSHTGLAAGMLKLYSHEIGDGDPARHHGNAFRDLMRSLGVYLADVGTSHFAENADITDAAFGDPVFLLSLSQFPRTFAPEILGLSLSYYVCGICPIYLALADRLERFGAATRFLEMHRLEASIRGPAETAVGMVRRRMEAAGGDPERIWDRIRRGFVAGCMASTDAIGRGLEFVESREKTPRERMIELVARKARHARGYHPASVMGGRGLEDWLNPEQLDPAGFLDAFAGSPYVSPGDAEGSMFFRWLVSFRGPMFRIFSPAELQVIADWIDGLTPGANPGEAAGPAPIAEHPRPGVSGPRESPDRPGATREQRARDSARRYARKPLGELYYYLLNIEYYPDVRPFAQQFATDWLRRARRGLRRGRLPLPFEPYRHADLDAWLDAQHTRQVGTYGGGRGEPAQTREELIESTTQLAPMILIDGAWIHNASNAVASHTLIGSRLFHIYADEVGNGEVELNHPNVYRELLSQMGVAPPEFGTLEFGRWPGFRPESFQIPVFWLSVSQFPKRFLSETLGLNLAMELSGVGGAYRNAIDTLRHYGYDPLFVELHNSIDNVSTGHTAWAVEAIKCHMDEILASGGADLVEEHWRRVWTGYRALAPQVGRMSRLWKSIRTFWED